MKLIIQIPCLNEEKTLPGVLKDLPSHIEGFDTIERLVIDDGSTDATQEVARAGGVEHIVSFSRNLGLAKAYLEGLKHCVLKGADVIVNVDADNQYSAKDIAKLVEPILRKEADLVIGARPINEIAHFSFLKKLFQHLGSGVVRRISGTTVVDATSGFRAVTKDFAMRINVFNSYTYTLETIIQAGLKNYAIVSVPIEVNDYQRPSRLVKNIFSYIKKSAQTIIRIFVVYKPFKFFMSLGSIMLAAGFLVGVRFLILLYLGKGAGHVQSLIFAAIAIGMGFQTVLVAFLADLLAVNRSILEEIQYEIRKKKVE